MSRNTGKKLTKKLSSIQLCFWLLALIILWLAAGIALALHPATGDAVYGMNKQLVIDWLLQSENPDWRAAAWLLVFCLLNLLLFINMSLCLALNLLKRILFSAKLKNSLLTVIHVLVLFVMLGHLANMAVGFKQERIKMTPGSVLDLPGGYMVELNSVHFAADLRLLTMDRHKARQEMTRDRFDLKENFADISVFRGRLEKAGKRIHIMEPLKLGSFRVTLNRFFAADKNGEKHAGAVITVSRNPIHEWFFLIYALMILSFLAYTAVCIISGPIRTGASSGRNRQTDSLLNY